MQHLYVTGVQHSIVIHNICRLYSVYGASQVALVVKNPPASAGDVRDAGSVPGLGRFPGGGDSNPLQLVA